MHGDAVLTIHKKYIESGADAIKTNTFAANSDFIPDENTLKDVIKAGCAIAREAAGDKADVFADMGPVKNEAAADEFLRLSDIFISCGMKNFLFETLPEAENLKTALKHIKDAVPDSFIIVSFAVTQDGYTRSGGYYIDLFREASEYGADVVGLNCICGPAHMRDLIKNPKAQKYACSAMPNAGYPTSVGGRAVYINNPDYFANKLLEIYSAGIPIVGGCCGTTPAHIKAFTEKLSGASPKKISVIEVIKTAAEDKREQAFSGTTIAVEINSPIDTDTDFVLEASRRAMAAGVDYITVPDSPLGKARANSFMISGLIHRETGIRVIPHICCRDKNQIAIKGDLIGAAIEGVRTVLAVTGDAIPEADRADAKNVFGFSSIKLISFIESLNRTVLSEKPVNICAALNVNAQNFDHELRRAEKKIAAGAACFFTQPIFTAKNVENFRRAKAELGCRILAGIMPLAGYKNALFLNNEVPGIEVPENVLQRLLASGPEGARAVCAEFAKSIVDEIGNRCDGYYIMTPLRKIEHSLDIVEYIRRGKNADNR